MSLKEDVTLTVSLKDDVTVHTPDTFPLMTESPTVSLKDDLTLTVSTENKFTVLTSTVFSLNDGVTDSVP